MKEIVYDNRFIKWAADRIPHCRFRPDAKAIGILRDGKEAGAFVFDLFSERNCFMNVASDGSRTWLSRDFLTCAFAFPFIQCGFARVSASIYENNAESIRLVQHLGARQEGAMRRAGANGEDILLFGMLRDECRWVAGITLPLPL